MDRRTLLGAAAALPIFGLAGCERWDFGANSGRAVKRRFFEMHNVAIGMQLYTVDPDLDSDFEGTLDLLAKAGLKSVELAGYHGKTPAQLRAAFDTRGMRCTSAHIQPRPVGNGPSFMDLEQLVADMKVIGVTDVVLPIPLFPADLRPPDQINAGRSFSDSGKAMQTKDWALTAAFLNDRAKALAGSGLKVGYHNHNFEFAPQEGMTGFDILLGQTDPKLVAMEMDIGWVAAGGGDPVAMLKAHPGRFTQCHVKDTGPKTVANFEAMIDPVPVGSGTLDWATILPAAYDAGVRGFFFEQEPPFPGPRIESVEKSLRFLEGVRV